MTISGLCQHTLIPSPLSLLSCACGLLSLLVLPALSGQDLAKKSPKTDFDWLAAESGAVIIKASSEVGTVTGTGIVSVSSREFTNTKTGRKWYGISLLVKAAGRLDQGETAFIDLAEVDALLAAIDSLGKITVGVTKLKQFEAVYVTKGDLAIAVLNYDTGKLSLAVSAGYASGGRTTMLCGMEKLNDLRHLILTAKSELLALKTP